MSITPIPELGQYPWREQYRQWALDTQAAAENATVAADQVHADVAGAVADAQAAQVAATNAAGLVDAPAGAAVNVAIQEGGAARETLIGSIGTIAGSNLGRFIVRCRAKLPVKIVAIGDSILQGTTVTSDGGVLGVDDCLPRVATLAAARFGSTVTPVNKALSGHTAAAGPLSLMWSAAISEQADLYVIGYGTNDWSADNFATPVPGYKTEASLAGVERLFRRLRAEVPKADLAFLLANPYASGLDSSSNIGRRGYDTKVRDVCAAYGVEVIDGYAAFAARPDRDELLADSIHPNTAGHHLLADTVMEHLNKSFNGQTAMVGKVSDYGLRHPELVDVNSGDTGARSVLAPTAVTWVEEGSGWSADGTARITSTPGDSTTTTVDAVEFYARLSTTLAHNARITVQVDGVDVWTNIPLSIAGRDEAAWVPLITVINKLGAGTHSFKIILVSGTLRVDRLGWLAGAVSSFSPNTAFVELGSGYATTTIPVDGSVVKVVDAVLALPSGWLSAQVEFRGHANCRTTGATVTERRFECIVRQGIVRQSLTETLLPAAGTTFSPSFTLSPPSHTMVGAGSVTLEVRLQSTDKTACAVASWALEAKLTRLS